MAVDRANLRPFFPVGKGQMGKSILNICSKLCSLYRLSASLV